jgi:hypothetical protein
LGEIEKVKFFNFEQKIWSTTFTVSNWGVCICAAVAALGTSSQLKSPGYASLPMVGDAANVLTKFRRSKHCWLGVCIFMHGKSSIRIQKMWLGLATQSLRAIVSNSFHLFSDVEVFFRIVGSDGERDFDIRGNESSPDVSIQIRRFSLIYLVEKPIGLFYSG